MAALGKDDALLAIIAGRESAGESQLKSPIKAAILWNESRGYASFAGLSKSIGEGITEERQKEFLKVVGAKSVNDPNLLANLDKDLKANPKLAAQILADMQSASPKMFTAIPQYTGGNLSTLLPAVTPEIKKPAPAVAAAPVAPATPAVTVAAAPAPTKAKPAAPAAAPAAVLSSQIPDAASVGAGEEILEIRRDRLSGGPDTGAPKKDAAAPAAPKDDGSARILQSFAEGSDEDIKDAMSPEVTAQMLTAIADKAASLGVNKADVNGFRKAVQDPKLQQNIAANLQKNPDFVRSMARMAQDKTPMSAIMKPTVLQEMNKFMANPELLASDDHVKGLQKQMKAGQDLQNQIGQYLGQFKSGMNNMMMMASGFGGQHSVLSMGQGGGLFPTLLINLHNFGRNQDEAQAFAKYSPSDMTALGKLGKDGKFFHTVIEKDAQGNDVKVDVPNGQMTLKTADGKEVKVIPAVGALMAKQEKGSLDANGNFVPGRVKVPVVTAIDEMGLASSIKNIYMTPAAFAEYKAKADALGAEKGGTYPRLEFQDYTATDLAKANGQKSPTVQVVRVDPMSGAAAAPTTVTAAPQPAQGAVSYPVKPQSPIESRELTAT